MRSFIITTCLFLAACFAGCATDDKNCMQTDGCQGPNPDATMPDPDGGQPAVDCGDGVCNASDGEDAASCSKDCSGMCSNSAQPIYCEYAGEEQITCNPVGTDCDLPVMATCGSGPERCPSQNAVGRCCDSGTNDTEVFWCDAGTFYCPNVGACVPSGTSCAYGTGHSCYYQEFACNTP